MDPEPGSNGERFVFLLVPYAYAVQANRYYESGDHTTTFAIIPRGARCREGEMVALTGRVLADENSTDYPNIVAARLDATASRFHPASVSGLVVAVMGCFIFGLYLRTWLGDRKALARQPGQDMIA